MSGINDEETTFKRWMNSIFSCKNGAKLYFLLIDFHFFDAESRFGAAH
jgi:hypothetical protein